MVQLVEELIQNGEFVVVLMAFILLVSSFIYLVVKLIKKLSRPSNMEGQSPMLFAQTLTPAVLTDNAPVIAAICAAVNEYRKTNNIKL